MAAAPQRLILASLLVASALPRSGGLAVVHREDGLGNGTAASRAELKARLEAARAEVLAEMARSGMVTKAREPIDPKPWDLLAGQGVNCIQTIVTATEPIWSVIEGAGSASDSCKSFGKECVEASLGVTESSLGALGYLMDFPTDCLGYSCAIKKDTEDERIHPDNFKLTMTGSVVDAASAIMGLGASGLGLYLQCHDKLGDTLGLPGKDPKYSPWIHPSMVSFVPVLKEVREILQIIKSNGEETRFQQLEKVAALLERVTGTVQSVKETQMDEEYNKEPPENSTEEGPTDEQKKASAEEGCIAAGAHVATSLLAFLGSMLKAVACMRGELELPADINEYSYKEDSKQPGKKDRNADPTPDTNDNDVGLQFSGGMDEEYSVSRDSADEQCSTIPKQWRNLGDFCYGFVRYYMGDKNLKTAPKGRMTKDGQRCRRKCCGEQYHEEVTTQVETILASDYCKEMPDV